MNNSDEAQVANPGGSKRKVMVVSAGLSSPSSSRMLGGRLLNSSLRALEHAGFTPEGKIFELRDYAMDITNNMLTGFANEKLYTMIEEVTSAHGLIMVTPIFSSSYSGLFKSFIDVLDPKSLTDKPVLLGATAGTQRHSLAIDYSMRPVFNYLHADLVDSGVFASADDWGSSLEASKLESRIEKASKQFSEKVSRNESAISFDPYAVGDFLASGLLK